MDHIPLKRPHFFFTTAALPCPYLPGRLERKIVTELNGPDSESLHEALSRAGFRRSHSIAYTPACPGCQACVPVRIVVNKFNPNRTMRKVATHNAGLIARMVPARATAEQYKLFSRYQESRHNGGDMALMGFYDYRSMVEDSPIDTFLLEFRQADDTLVGGVLDRPYGRRPVGRSTAFTNPRCNRHPWAPMWCCGCWKKRPGKVCLSSIWAIGSRKAAKWLIKPASSRWKPSAPTAGNPKATADAAFQPLDERHITEIRNTISIWPSY